MKNGIRIFIICSWAFLFAQGPAFILQYMNHLSGHMQELNYQEGILKKMMKEDDLTLLTLKLRESREHYGMLQGDYIESFIQRKTQFESAHVAFKNSSPWSVAFYFLRFFDFTLAQETVTDFNFAIPFTFDGIFYGLVGALVGNLIWFGLVRLFRKTKPEVVIKT